MNRAEELEKKEVVLDSMAVNPFRGWSDWYGAEGEAVVTFETMQHVLWNAWQNHCIEHKSYDEDGNEIKAEDFDDMREYFDSRSDVEDKERVVEPEEFDYSKVRSPGIRRDGTYYDEEDSVDEGYTITVPYGFLSPKLCKEYIERLNEKFNRNFRLEIKEEQKPPYAEIARLKFSADENEKELYEKFYRALHEGADLVVYRGEGKAAELYKDGYVEDMAGTGKWHIEHMQDNKWYFGADLDGKFTRFHIRLDEEGRISIEPYEEQQEYVEKVVEEREGVFDREKPELNEG